MFGGGHGENGGEAKGMQQDILINACDTMSRSYAFLNWGYILMYDQLSKRQDEDDGTKLRRHAKKDTDAKYSSVAGYFINSYDLLKKLCKCMENIEPPSHLRRAYPGKRQRQTNSAGLTVQYTKTVRERITICLSSSVICNVLKMA